MLPPLLVKSNPLITKADPSIRERSADSRGIAAGVDVGATLAKLAVRGGDGQLGFRLLPSHGIERAAREVEHLRPARLGMTGGGASELARRIGTEAKVVNEFEAWRIGARVLLARQGETPATRDLLVSLGTGTSVLLVESHRITRVGGTALGGGTLLGLGAALARTTDFEQLAALADTGDRRNVDLLVSDIYRDGERPLPGHLNASSFAKLGRPPYSQGADRRDLAHALMGLVGENVALICAGLAAQTRAERIVFGGSTLRDNPALLQILGNLVAALGREPVFLVDGEFAGAVGALELVEGRA
jgi:type II pantothenate kinase